MKSFYFTESADTWINSVDNVGEHPTPIKTSDGNSNMLTPEVTIDDVLPSHLSDTAETLASHKNFETNINQTASVKNKNPFEFDLTYGNSNMITPNLTVDDFIPSHLTDTAETLVSCENFETNINQTTSAENKNPFEFNVTYGNSNMLTPNLTVDDFIPSHLTDTAETIVSCENFETNINQTTSAENKNPFEFDVTCSESGKEVELRVQLELKKVKVKEGYAAAEEKVNHSYILVKPKTGNNTAEKYVSKDLGYPCLTCGIIASTERVSRRHKIAHDKGFKCSFCPQVFFMGHIARSHQRLHKLGDLQFVDDICQCKLCGGSFISLMYLEFHIFEIHGEFSLMNPKVVHLGTPYTDEPENNDCINEVNKPFRCGVCNTLFQYSLNLDCHMVFHERYLYACAICDSSYSMLDNLLTHAKIHDNEEDITLYESYKVNCDSVSCQPGQRRMAIGTAGMKTTASLSSKTTNGTCSNGTCPSDACSSGACSSGACSNGACSSGTWFNGACSNDACSNGACSNGTSSNIYNGKVLESESHNFPPPNTRDLDFQTLNDQAPFFNPHIFQLLPGGKYYKA